MLESFKNKQTKLYYSWSTHLHNKWYSWKSFLARLKIGSFTYNVSKYAIDINLHFADK